MAYNHYKTISVEKTFAAGVVIGALKSHLAANGSGELNFVRSYDDTIEIEIATYNPLVMSYAESQLAPFV